MARRAKNRAASSREVAGLIRKLRQWSRQLPAKERQILDVLLARAKGSILEADVRVRVPHLLNLTGVKARPKPWVKAGPGWIRG